MNRVTVLGTKIDNFSMEEVLARMVELMGRGSFGFAVTPNVDHLIQLRRGGSLRAIYARADLVVADGVPLLWASRLLGDPLKQRINGTDLFELSCGMARDRGLSVFLLGGNPGSAERAGLRLQELYPGLRIAGVYCPPLGFHTDERLNQEIQERIRESGCDLLFVGLGAPKQEDWIYEYGSGSGAKFAVGIGVSFSFVAGDIARAPLWMQRGGLEWLWRLWSEPRRLWRRYLIEDMPFIGLVALDVIRKRLGVMVGTE